MAHNPNSELVAVSFLRSLTLGSSAFFGVGTTLPENKDTWRDGFVQVSVVGGTSDIDVPTRRPVLQIDAWVPAINSSKPQWGKANTIAEDIVAALYQIPVTGTKISLGSNFKDAIVQTGYAVGEPRRISNDPAGHARYTVDISLTWVVDSETPTP
jgi:hypothetical protein